MRGSRRGFNGYTCQYFRNKVMLYGRLSSQLYVLLCFQDAMRHRNLCKDYGNSLKVFKTIIFNEF